MSTHDRARGMGQLPGWRTSELHEGQREAMPVRRPIVRPADFVQAQRGLRRRDEPVAAVEKPVSAAPVAPIAPAAVVEQPIQPEPVHTVGPIDLEAPPLKSDRTYVEPVAGPILDLRMAAKAMWSNRLLLLILAVVFAGLGAVLMSFSSSKFTAATSIYFDPRQAGGPDSSQGSVAPEMVSTMIDSQTEILSSGKVLGRVVDALKLDVDPRFNGGAAGDMARNVAIATLQKAVVIAREAGTYVLALKVTTSDPEKSAAIANQVVTSFIDEEAKAASSLYQSTNNIVDGRLADLQQQVFDAEKAVSAYRADNDLMTVQGNLVSDTRLTALNQALVTAQQKTIDAKARADAAKSLRFEDVVSTTRPDAAGSTSNSLSNLRSQYASLAANVSSLEAQLGSRHPRLLAARSSLESLAGEIKSELQRQASAAQSDYEQAQKAEQDVAKEAAVQKAQQVNSSGKLAGLNELDRKASAARDAYQALVKRSGQSDENHSLMQNGVRVLSEATPPLKADGQSKKVMIIAGTIGGAMLGLGLGAMLSILIALFRHPALRGYFSKA